MRRVTRGVINKFSDSQQKHLVHLSTICLQTVKEKRILSIFLFLWPSPDNLPLRERETSLMQHYQLEIWLLSYSSSLLCAPLNCFQLNHYFLLTPRTSALLPWTSQSLQTSTLDWQGRTRWSALVTTVGSRKEVLNVKCPRMSVQSSTTTSWDI